MGARGLRRDLKGCSIFVRMSQSMGPRRKDTRGRKEMNQSILRGSKWVRGSGERERESVAIGEVSSLGSLSPLH